MHDCITRVPFIVWSPNRFGGGRRETGLWQQMDLRPGPAGAGRACRCPEDLGSRLHGARPAGGSGAAAGREHVFCEQAGDNILAGTELMTMVRGREWKLVHYLGLDEGELYHLPADPGERTNLWSSADRDAAAPRRRACCRPLLEWRLRGGLRAPRQAQVLS